MGAVLVAAICAPRGRGEEAVIGPVLREWRGLAPIGKRLWPRRGARASTLNLPAPAYFPSPPLLGGARASVLSVNKSERVARGCRRRRRFMGASVTRGGNAGGAKPAGGLNGGGAGGRGRMDTGGPSDPVTERASGGGGGGGGGWLPLLPLLPLPRGMSPVGRASAAVWEGLL